MLVVTVEHCYGQVNRVLQLIEWLADNGSCDTARDTRAFARGIGLIPRTTLVSSPQSNGTAEAFVRTLKTRSCPRNPQAQSAGRHRSTARLVAYYNEVHSHRALRYRSPRGFIAKTCDTL